MNRCKIVELSKIYKSVLDIELTLKEKLFNTFCEIYLGNEFSRLIPYLNFILPHSKYVKGKGKKRRDKINDLIKSNKTQKEKLFVFFKNAYLLDVLNILTKYEKVYKDKKFKRQFYCTIPDFNQLKQNASILNSLRNSIMHFDYDTFASNKIRYFEALRFWENTLNCKTAFMHNLPKVKTTIGKLRILSENYDEFWNLDDRTICDLFDDIAIINGISIDKLPPLWGQH